MGETLVSARTGRFYAKGHSFLAQRKRRPPLLKTRARPSPLCPCFALGGFARKVMTVVGVVIKSARDLWPVVALMLLMLYVFTVLGMQLFGAKMNPYVEQFAEEDFALKIRFDTFFWSFVQVACCARGIACFRPGLRYPRYWKCIFVSRRLSPVIYEIAYIFVFSVGRRSSPGLSLEISSRLRRVSTFAVSYACTGTDCLWIGHRVFPSIPPSGESDTPTVSCRVATAGECGVSHAMACVLSWGSGKRGSK